MDSCKFTKANSHTPKAQIPTRQKLCYFGHYVTKANLLCLKSFVPFKRAGVFIWDNFDPGNRDPGNRASPASRMNTSTLKRKERVARRDLGN